MRSASLFPILALGLALSACAVDREVSPSAQPTEAADPEWEAMDITCGGPGFPASVLDAPGGAENGSDPAAEALRDHLATPSMETDWLPDDGWKEAVRTNELVVFIADSLQGNEQPPLVQVSIELLDGAWRVAGTVQCRPQVDVGPGLGLASFRVAPGVELAADMTEIEVLVTERACNSGQDARGRIAEPSIVARPESVTVLFAVRPRAGGHDCPSNPETPFTLILDESLGNRVLLDGSEIPPRDATQCADIWSCPP